MKRFMLAIALSFTASASNAMLIFSFDSANGGTQTNFSLSGSALANSSGNTVNDYSLSFDFWDFGDGVDTTQIFDLSASNVMLTGSVSGAIQATQLDIGNDDFFGVEDDLELSLGSSFQLGETLTGSGSALLNVAFSTFVGGGSATSPTGAPFDIAIGDASTVPSPATLALFGLGLAGLGWSKRKKA